jgi:lysozyme
MQLLDYLKQNEGLRLRAYQDTLGIWTVGYGQTGPKIVEGVVVTLEEAEAMLERSGHNARDAAMRVVGLSTWERLTPARQLALSDMAYQMGEGGLARFVRALAAIREERWSDAATEMLGSVWAKQTPKRAARNVAMVLSGEFVA